MLKINAIAETATSIEFALLGDLCPPGLAVLSQTIAEAQKHGQIVHLDLSGIVLVDRPAMKMIQQWKDAGVHFKGCPRYVSSWIDQERCS